MAPQAASAAPAYPDHPVTIVVPYPPGGGPDILARVLSEAMGRSLGQAVLVENRGGAGGNIGGQYVAHSRPDGYTLLMCAFSCSVAPLIYTPAPFDLQKDFDPIVLAGKVPSVLLVNPGVPAHTLNELLAYAKSHPGKLNAASSGIGSSPHLAIELLRTVTGVSVTHVPYKGSGQVTGDLLSGQVDMYFDNLPPSLPNIKNGQLRALAVTSEKRSPSLPDVPTFTESGFPDFVLTPWFGLMAPANTPDAVLDKLNQAVNLALKDPTVAQRVKDLGVEDAGGTRADITAFINGETKKWQRVVKQNHVQAQ